MDETKQDFLAEVIAFVEKQAGIPARYDSCENWDSVDPRDVVQAVLDFVALREREKYCNKGDDQEPEKKSGPSFYYDFLST